MHTLEKVYREKVVPAMMDEFRYANIMQVPKLSKITINMGVGAAAADKKLLTGALNELTLIAGQKAVQTAAKKSIAGFKIRAGWPIGCKVTLRGDRMHDFIQRLLNIALPRVRDFRGLNARSFDGRGNYSFGVKEQLIFPEIDFDKIDTIRGMDITVTTTAKTNQEAFLLLKLFNFPFRDIT